MRKGRKTNADRRLGREGQGRVSWAGRAAYIDVCRFTKGKVLERCVSVCMYIRGTGMIILRLYRKKRGCEWGREGVRGKRG